MARIFLNAGHGGNDSGAVANGLKEKDINLKITLALFKYLRKNGVDVYISDIDKADGSQTSNDVLKLANKYTYDYCIDIHCNTFSKPKARGFECYIGKSGLAKTLANNIEKEIKSIGLPSRGIKTRTNKAGNDYYYFIRQTISPAIILETLFLSNKEDIEFISSDEKINKIAKAYGDGILKTLDIVPKVELFEFKPFVGRVKHKIDLFNSDLKKIGNVTRGAYTCVDIKGDYYKLKSGAGYIRQCDIIKLWEV